MKQPNKTTNHQSISRGSRWLAILLCLILPTAPVLAGDLTLYYPDASGNPVVAVDVDVRFSSNGNSVNEITSTILWREHYQPYGEKINEPLGEDIGYTGHEYDAETGLTYMQARYYDAEVGRFLAIDPVGFKPNQPMTFNRYSYANNNPYKYVDPNGEFVVAAAIIFTGTVLVAGAAISSNPEASKEIAGAVSGAIDRVQTSVKTHLAGALLDAADLIVMNENSDSAEGQTSNDTERNPSDDKRLSGGEIKKLDGAGHDVHEIKGGKNASKKDLFKDKKGDVYVKPKDGSGPGDPTGINIKDL